MIKSSESSRLAMNRLADFMREKVLTATYPEPPSPIHDEITAKVLPDVIAALKNRKPRVLDVGCGQGVALEKFVEWGCDTIGTTLNEHDLAILKGKGLNVVYRMQEDLDGEWESTFDLVWARHVLEHSIAPFWTLHEFWRVLKPGGLLYLEMPAPSTSCFHESNVNHYSVLTQQGWIALISRTGFVIEKSLALNLQTGAGPDTYYSYLCKKPLKGR